MPRKRKPSDEDSKSSKNTIESYFIKPPKKARIVIDSDEEDEGKPKQKCIDSIFKTPSPKKVKSKSELNNNASSKKLTPVSAKDFFGTGSISRKEKTPAKMKIEEIDSEKHDDDDFEQTLQQLDTNSSAKKARFSKSPKKSSETEDIKLSPLKNDLEKLDDLPSMSVEKDICSIASKLSSKMKHIVEDTPEPKKHKHSKVVVPDTPEVKKKSPKKNLLYKMEIVKSEFHQEQQSPPKKADKTPNSKKPSSKKISPTSNSSSSPQEETEKKKGSGYMSYLHREGPQALGSKEIPEGADNCLDGLVFVITGVLESLERDEAKSLIERYSGKVTTTLGKKTNYVVIGRDCGQSKLEKARAFGTKQLDEDGLLDLIKSRPGRKSKCELKAEESIKKEKSFSKKLENFQKTDENVKMLAPSGSPQKITDKPAESLMWVDKYKPIALKNIIGQQGARSNANKLLHWLTNWHKNQAAGVKPQGKFFGKDDGAGLKAALLSGPPGIGKTTTATLVCQEAGFSFVELNASDTRSKKSLQLEVAEALNNETLIDFMGPKRTSAHGHKHCLLMDEVDGMAGNEDRGGLQALVQLVKTTKIPIICMCNDRNHQKMRTLSNYCFDLRFQKPRLEQIKAAMMTMAFKENLKIPAPALNEIIQAANHDIRQVIHNISMWTSGNKSMTYEQAKRDSSSAKKDLKIGPFDVCRKVFVGAEETAGMTLGDKSDLFFHDYSFAPLFVHENYPHVLPYSTSGNIKRHLSLLARTADSICDGDLTDKKIRSQQMWSLLPAQAIYASVLPGEFMRGSFPQMVNFPAWLGKNSSQTKTERILQELRTHMRLKVSAEKRSLNMDYLPYLRHGLTSPLVNKETQGVPEVIKLMDEYDIIKEDFDNILEVTKWPNSGDPMASLSPSTKAAFTRSYNKEVHLTPYSTGNVIKKRRGGGGAALDEEMLEENGDDAVQPDSDEEKDSIETDTMIKVKKKSSAKVKTSAKGQSSSETKGKGKGRGKGKS